MLAVWMLVGVVIVAGCERSEPSDETEVDTRVDKQMETERGRPCRALEKQLAELRDERTSLASKREAVRDRLGDLEEAIAQLDKFEPNLEATTLHIFRSDSSPHREIGGHIRNGTDATVAVMHIETTLVPKVSGREPIKREIAYTLREPLESGEVQHAPYGQQILDAYPDVEVEVWSDAELQFEVMALEGPDGDVLWDRRGRGRAALEKRIDKIEGEIERLDEQIGQLESTLAERREGPEGCE